MTSNLPQAATGRSGDDGLAPLHSRCLGRVAAPVREVPTPESTLARRCGCMVGDGAGSRRARLAASPGVMFREVQWPALGDEQIPPR